MHSRERYDTNTDCSSKHYIHSPLNFYADEIVFLIPRGATRLMYALNCEYGKGTSARDGE